MDFSIINLHILTNMTDIEQMSLNERLEALMTIPQLREQIVSTNRSIHSLTIIIIGRLDVPDNLKVFESKINLDSIADKVKSAASLNENTSVLFKLHRLTPFNCLHFRDEDTEGTEDRFFGGGEEGQLPPSFQYHLDSSTVRQIINTFPAVTELTILNRSSQLWKYMHCLVELLRAWKDQLTAFTFVNAKDSYPTLPTTDGLFSAINELPVLKTLTIKLQYHLQFHTLQLPLLSQLTAVHFSFTEGRNMKEQNQANLDVFMRSLKQFSKQSFGCLQVDLPNAHLYMDNDDSILASISASHQIRFIRVNLDTYSQLNLVSRVSRFPWLICLALETTQDGLKTLFSKISSLKHLLFLKLKIDFENVSKEKTLISFPFSSALKTVKGVDLVGIQSHTQLQWLNLPVIMPSLEAIHFTNYICCLCCEKKKVVLFDDCCPHVCGQFLADLRSTGVSFCQITFRSGRSGGVVTAEEAEEALDTLLS